MGTFSTLLFPTWATLKNRIPRNEQETYLYVASSHPVTLLAGCIEKTQTHFAFLSSKNSQLLRKFTKFNNLHNFRKTEIWWDEWPKSVSCLVSGTGVNVLKFALEIFSNLVLVAKKTKFAKFSCIFAIAFRNTLAGQTVSPKQDFCLRRQVFRVEMGIRRNGKIFSFSFTFY